MNEIKNQTFDLERALYASRDVLCIGCTFAGPADGESAFKESHGITVRDCNFRLRYPFWHNTDLLIADSTFTETARAPLWYTSNAIIRDTELRAPKALRECAKITVDNCDITSAEFGWMCRDVVFSGGSVEGEYFMFRTDGITMKDTHFKGKYSFQYTKNVEIHNCILDTKDTFWHAENVTVYDSEVRGEYLAWYAKNIRFVRCRIIGTQPLCYTENLVMEDCTMEGCDLSFEYATVQADIRGEIMSVKNPAAGFITADRIGEIILDEHRRKDTVCEITERNP